MRGSWELNRTSVTFEDILAAAKNVKRHRMQPAKNVYGPTCAKVVSTWTPCRRRQGLKVYAPALAVPVSCPWSLEGRDWLPMRLLPIIDITAAL
jgi:hypothetical protein